VEKAPHPNCKEKLREVVKENNNSERLAAFEPVTGENQAMLVNLLPGLMNAALNRTQTSESAKPFPTPHIRF
jgi:hypothetical protein